MVDQYLSNYPPSQAQAAPQTPPPVVDIQQQDAPPVQAVAPPVVEPVQMQQEAPPPVQQTPTPPPVQQAVAEPVAPVVDNTPKIGDTPETQFYDSLSAFTGGIVKTKADWETFQSERNELATAREQLTALQAEKAGLNPLAAKVHELASKGASAQEISTFVQLQNTDFGAMKDLDVIRTKIAMENPFLNADEVEAMMLDGGFVSDTDSPTPSMTAKVKVEAVKARTFLDSQKVAAGAPPSIAQNQQQQQAREQITAKWQALPVPENLTYKFVAPDGYAADINLSKEAIDYGVQFAKGWGVSTGADPEAAKQTFNQLVLAQAAAYDMEKVVSFVRSDVAAKTEQRVRAELAGAPPPPVQPNTPPPSNAPSQRIQFSS